MSIQPFTIKTEKQSENFGHFVIEPLIQGYGDTLGNALRRVLYTSIQGAAITSVNISGVTHQFTSLPGVMEDVVTIILNLKQVHLTYTGDKPVSVSLSAKGVGVVKAGDFELPTGITISNPDLVIATLTDKSAKLELEAIVESGFGYSPAEDRKTTTLGTIVIDATFTPVVRTNYKVEATRVGRITNFDKLNLEILTNGTITPEKALTLAASTLVEYFTNIVSPQNSSPSQGAGGTVKSPQGSSISIEELDLPTRIGNALQKAGFSQVSDILATPKGELSKIKNLGGKSVKVVEEALNQRGFSLA